MEGKRTKVRGDGVRCYVRYGTKDYRTPDAGFPKPLSDNWWNMPDGLHLGPVDAVFTGRDNHTYLFSGNRFVRFDARHRWWSEPMTLRTEWDSVPFEWVDAAFVGQDGRTYLFSDDKYVRYSTSDYTEVDDGYPSYIAGYWDNVRNNIERTGRVDAALVTEVTEQVDGVDVPRTYTYLFSGDQYVRYLGVDYAHVQPGYPRLLDALDTEPGLTALDTPIDRSGRGVRRPPHHLPVQRRAVPRRLRHHVPALRRPRPRRDLLRVHRERQRGDVHGRLLDQALRPRGPRHAGRPPRSGRERCAPSRSNFRTGLDSVLMGADGNTYLFKGADCFNTQLKRAYPLAQEWGRPRNVIYEQGRVDAAFVGRDGSTYLFSDDQFVVYPDASGTIEGDPKPIAEHWAGLESVALAYVRGDQTYLFEQPDDEGMVRYVVYSGTDYSEPDDGYPAVTDTGFHAAPDGFPFPDAVLVDDDTMILLSGEDCVSYNTRTP